MRALVLFLIAWMVFAVWVQSLDKNTQEMVGLCVWFVVFWAGIVWYAFKENA